MYSKTSKKTRKIKNKMRKQQSKHTRKSSKNVFKNAHYTSGDGMLTSVWGPGLWHFLHTISFNYPIKPSNKDKKYYRQFISLLKYVLPCKYCRINFLKNLKQLPLNKSVFKDRESFSKYMFRLHEHVNKSLGKASNLTYENVRDRYEHFRARCGSNKTKRKSTVLNKTKKKENGCVDPLNGKKSKCVIHIVPATKKCKTFNMNV